MRHHVSGGVSFENDWFLRFARMSGIERGGFCVGECEGRSACEFENNLRLVTLADVFDVEVA